MLMTLFPNTGGVSGIKLRDNRARDTNGNLINPPVNNNVNTMIANNVIYGFNQDPLIFSERTGTLDGITLKNNLYFSPAAKPFSSSDVGDVLRTYTLAEWQRNTGSEINSQFTDPMLENIAHFRAAAPELYDYKNATSKAGSPLLGAGTPQTFTPAVNFELLSRTTWNIGAF